MRIVKIVLFFFLSFVAASTMSEEVSPHQKVEKATTELLALITEAKEYYEKDPDRYYQGVEKIMDELIDFGSFTRSVMGPYGTKEYYASLSEQKDREQYKADYKRFVKTFREGLINTYGKGMLAFNGQKVEVEKATEEDKKLMIEQQSVDVIQNITGDNEVYKVVYKMRPDSKGVWLLRNVSIGSVNVGALYRNQFIAAMDKNNQDFGKVIDTWVIEAQIEDKQAETEAKTADKGAIGAP